MGTVICKLPRAGLGNQLFPLLKAYTFAQLNDLPVIVINYHQIKVGPWLRREKSKRFYDGFFLFERNWIATLIDRWRAKRIDSNGLIVEPEIKTLDNNRNSKSSFLFHEIPHYTNRFKGLKENYSVVLERFDNLIRPSIKEKLAKLKPPCIGVHIRMGDFRKLKSGEEFGKAGTIRTPEEYFVETIKSIRKVHGSDLPVSIFTDGNMQELSQLLQIQNVEVIEGNNDLVDLLLLSKSKIIVTSASSTFSYWAAFISSAVVIMHPSFKGIKIRPETLKDKLYEGPFDEGYVQLINAIKTIKL